MPSAVEFPLWKVVVGCIGGFLIHLVIGSLYQWGLINIYVASYYKITEPDLRLENTAVVFPLMMTCIGIGMRPGILLASKIGTFWVLIGVEIVASLLVLASSFIPSFVGFVAVFGAVFGLIVGMSFMLPMMECNKYLPGRRMYVNGVILIGTGMSSALFGQFSYRFLNPNRIPSNLGYYDGNLQYIAEKLPQCVRYLSLFYASVGLLGCMLLFPVIRHNQLQNRLVSESVPDVSTIELAPVRPLPATIDQLGNGMTQNLTAVADNQIIEPTTKQQQATTTVLDCPSYAHAFKSSLCWMLAAVVIFGSCGDLLLNGNYKTYVKKQITDDEFLTLIGTIGAIGNGCTRFFWNLLFNTIGFRPALAIIMCINIAMFASVNYTVGIRQLYCFLVFLANSCLGGLLVITPTTCLQFYGSTIGAGIYSFYWLCFSLANFIGYLYVSQLSLLIGFPNVLYVTLGMNAVVLIIIASYRFEPKWSQPDEAVQTADANV